MCEAGEVNRLSREDSAPEYAASKPEIILLILLIVACHAFVWGCWSAPFAPVDDIEFIQNSRAMKDGAPWSLVFTAPDVDDFYMPATCLSLRLDRVIYQPLLGSWLGANAWPAGIRTTNVLLHAICILLVWQIMRGLGTGRAVRCWVVTAFALHPTVCMNICWALERKTLLSAMFGFLALAQYSRARSTIQSFSAATLYTLALLAKPAALGFLPVVCVWEAFGRPLAQADRAPSFPRKDWIKTCLRLAPWILVSLLCAAYSIKAGKAKDDILPPIGGTIWTAILTDVLVLWRYIVNLIWPANLSFDYAISPVVNLLDTRLWQYLGCLLALALGTVILAERGSRRLAIVGWLAFIGALGPVLNLVGRNNLMTDSYIYYSSPAFWMVLGLSAEGAIKRAGAMALFNSRRVMSMIAIHAVILLAFTSVRSTLFSDWFKLIWSAAQVEPASSSNHLLLAVFYSENRRVCLAKGQIREAQAFADMEIGELRTGIASVSFDRVWKDGPIYNMLGQALYDQRQYDEAFAVLTDGLAQAKRSNKSNKMVAHQILGMIDLNRHNPEDALKNFDAALALAPDLTSLNLHRAQALLFSQKMAEDRGDLARANAAYALALSALRAVGHESEVYAEAQAALKQCRSSGIRAVPQN